MNSLPDELLSLILHQPDIDLPTLRNLRACSWRFVRLVNPVLYSTLWLCYGCPSGDDDDITSTARDHNLYYRAYVKRRTQSHVKALLNGSFLHYVHTLVIFDAATHRPRFVEDDDRMDEQVGLLQDVISACTKLKTVKIRLNTAELTETFAEERTVWTTALEAQLAKRLFINPGTNSPSIDLQLSITILFPDPLSYMPQIALHLSRLCITHQYIITSGLMHKLNIFLHGCKNLKILLLDVDRNSELHLDMYFPKLEIFALAELAINYDEFYAFVKSHGPTLRVLALDEVQYTPAKPKNWISFTELLQSKEMDSLEIVKMKMVPERYAESLGTGGSITERDVMAWYDLDNMLARRRRLREDTWQIFERLKISDGNVGRITSGDGGGNDAANDYEEDEEEEDDEDDDTWLKLFARSLGNGIIQDALDLRDGEYESWSRCSRGGLNLFGDCVDQEEPCSESWLH